MDYPFHEKDLDRPCVCATHEPAENKILVNSISIINWKNTENFSVEGIKILCMHERKMVVKITSQVVIVMITISTIFNVSSHAREDILKFVETVIINCIYYARLSMLPESCT